MNRVRGARENVELYQVLFQGDPSNFHFNCSLDLQEMWDIDLGKQMNLDYGTSI